MNKTNWIGFAAIATALVASVTLVGRANARPAQGSDNRKGSVTPWKAMEIAEHKTGGHAVAATFEFEDGKWGYAVYVIRDHKLMEVELDKMSGKVGDTESATPSGEAKEIESDLKQAMKKY